jgi:hypothetical protein
MQTFTHYQFSYDAQKAGHLESESQGTLDIQVYRQESQCPHPSRVREGLRSEGMKGIRAQS